MSRLQAAKPSPKIEKFSNHKLIIMFIHSTNFEARLTLLIGGAVVLPILREGGS